MGNTQYCCKYRGEDEHAKEFGAEGKNIKVQKAKGVMNSKKLEEI